ncbi:MAG: hypothetical protein M1820_007140 [Bogoriella megaspora]|nr:MAG: hypothetical protein M1820_007140 [Bogoriella megaspora]
MTAFIPSLPRGTPFKTSVHCWETPKPSLDAESAKSRGEKVVFGAKAFIDGVCVTQAIDPYTDWPQLIGDESNGTHQQLLKFPPFHPEILQEAIWDARETLGRIKVVISEGVTKGSGVDDYTPMRNIVCFAFQHAPLEILERTNISWPNTIMWRAVLDPMGTIGNNGAMPLRQYQQQTPTVPRLDTHAHSPRARVHTLASSCYSGHSFLPTASAGPVNNDPFTEEQILRGAPTQNAMPNTGNGNVSGQGNAAEFRLPEDQLVRLLEALSPRSRSRYFTPCEQANQPRSSSTRAADQTPSANGISWESPLPDLTRILRAISTGRQSTASQAAAPAQRSSIRDVLLAAKEGNIPDRKHEREQTDISMHMGCSDYPNCDHDGQRYNDVDNESPAKRVKGKKEGSTSKEKGDIPTSQHHSYSNALISDQATVSLYQ